MPYRLLNGCGGGKCLEKGLLTRNLIFSLVVDSQEHGDDSSVQDIADIRAEQEGL